MRTVFFGTPEIALPALAALADTTELVAVVCQPDRPAGRGLSLKAPPVKLAAARLGVEVHQPVKVKTGNLDAWLRERSPDVAVVLAYGRILPKAVLEAPRRGCMNLHASLLPRWRGAAPIEHAILAGDLETGISLMQMDEGLDTGPVYSRRAIEIGPDETAGELSQRMAELAALVVREDLPRAVSGELPAVPQDATLATHAPPIRAEDARVDWSEPAAAIVNRVRAMTPKPGAHTRTHDKLLRLLAVRAHADAAPGAPGTVLVRDRGAIVVATGSGSLEILRAQLEGRRPLDARDLVNGRTLRTGDVLGEQK
jgi:methionyl-tRNA formyltransferase